MTAANDNERANPIVLSCGLGTNSIAIICGWVEKGLPPFDAIMFSDTGGEKPHTYAYLATLNEFLRSNGFPEVTVVSKGGRVETLEENCLRMKMLPSLAYGRKGCSHKFKIQPQEKECNRIFRNHFRSGGKVDKLLGYDFHETRRWMKAKVEDGKYFYRFPLVEWEWSRADCVAAITRAGLPLPGKSACFFCPASTKPEIDKLEREHPLLFQRALALEDNARSNLKSVMGLGRRFSWSQYKGIPGWEPKKAPLPLFEIAACSYCVDFEDAADNDNEPAAQSAA